MSQAELVGILNEESQAGDTVINDAGTLPGDLHKLWDVTNGTTCHLEFGYSTMGYALPAGLGVRMARPEGEVYVFIGDHTYLMAPSELVTAMLEGWNPASATDALSRSCPAAKSGKTAAKKTKQAIRS